MNVSRVIASVIELSTRIENLFRKRATPFFLPVVLMFHCEALQPIDAD